jgi:small subunit ribosomal protein S11
MADNEQETKKPQEEDQVAAQPEKEPSAQPEKESAAPGEGAAEKSQADASSPAAESRAAPVRQQGRSRGYRSVSNGIAHIKATFNNTMVSITDAKGGVVGWSSAGRAGFKGSRKSTAFAATLVGQDAARQAVGRGMREVEVRVQGAGAGRESAIRALQSSGLTVTVIKDVTPIPHNGCRSRKRRRV